MNRLFRKIDHFFHPIKGEIWMLHRVTNHGTKISDMQQYEITPTRLEELLTQYRQKGYQFVSIDQVYEMQQSKIYLSQPFVCVTLDDGYLDNLTEALPVFRKFDCPFCVYVTTGLVDGTTDCWWYSSENVPFLSHPQLRQLAAEPLCTIGAHTVTHPHLSHLSTEEKRKEIIDSRHRLEEILNAPIIHFAYPHGDFDAECVNIVRQAGFHTAVMAWGGGVRSNSCIFALPRVKMN